MAGGWCRSCRGVWYVIVDLQVRSISEATKLSFWWETSTNCHQHNTDCLPVVWYVCLSVSVCLFVCLTRCVFLSVWVCVCFVVSTLSAYQSLACFCFFFSVMNTRCKHNNFVLVAATVLASSQCTNTLSIKIFFLPLKHILSPRPPVCNICISTKCMTKMTLFCCCAGNYMQMMMVLKPIAFDVVIYMTQLFDYYLYSVDIYFHCIFM